MPWTGSAAFDYSVIGITQNAPARSGVYAIFGRARWIYVGESGDIQARLLQHVGGDNDCINRSNPTQFAFELAESTRRVARQDALILESQPECNRRLG